MNQLVSTTDESGVRGAAAPIDQTNEFELAHNPLNDDFDIFDAMGGGLTPPAAAFCFNKVKRAMQGIGGITRLLIASGAADENDQLNGYLTGSLLTAANTLAEYAETDIEELAEWASKRAAEANHD
jgi:hypothetical protein